MRIAYNLKKLQDYARAGMIWVRKLNVHDRWTRQELVKLQHQQLLSLVTYAMHHSPFYRELYRNIRTDQQIVLNELPTIDKATMMENFDQIVTDPKLKLKELQAHITQLIQDEYYLGEYRVLTTSGSSGMKGVFVFNRKEWSTILAASFRCSLTLGIYTRFTKRLRLTWIGPDNPIHISNRMVVSMDVGYVKLQRLEVTSTTEYLVDALNAFQPEVLTTYPSIASLLAIEQIEGRLNIYPKIIETGGEVRTNEMELNIRKAWGITPFNLYLTTEGGAINFDCPFHFGIHIFEDLSIVEVVDEQNQPVQDGTPGYKVLLTNLFNFTQPLIRYEISDMLTMSTESCPCGRPYRLISMVEGRSDDIIFLQNFQGRDMPVHPIHFRSPMGVLHEIKEYNIVHEEDGINIHIVLQEGAPGEEVADKLKSNLSKNLQSLGAKCPDIYIRFVDKIDRDPKVMGKLKLVKSNVRREEKKQE
jgi:putative adenylate-forming enzyme